MSSTPVTPERSGPIVLRSTKPHPCPVCDCTTAPAGEAVGSRSKRTFRLHRCTVCNFVFVTDPWTEYAKIYDEAYYRGEGSDPLVDYATEFASPEETVRRYEWRGVERIAERLRPEGGKWLDFGCGNGGLVRHCKASGRFEMFGFDTGAWAEKARASGLPILHEAELAAHAGTCDLVTAIEVVEHLVDPVATLRQVRQLLKPGGILFLTTGNSSAAPADLGRWAYVQPEIHVSYFNPTALELALRRAGFKTRYRGPVPGWSDIIRFKCLKSLRVKRRNLFERCLPWRLFTPLIDKRYRISVYPVGEAN